MRLFIAINFKESEKNQIQDIIKEINKIPSKADL